MKTRCRPVKEEDIDSVCTFPQTEEELFFLFPKATFPLSPSQLKESISNRSDSTVIEADDIVSGFANFYQWENGGRCSIGNVIVSPHVRGHGVGRHLITCMIDIAKSKHHAKEIHISCFNANVIGLLLYKQLGFAPYDIEERNDRRGNRVALIHMLLNT